ncbi:hypothetical protein Tco_0137423, partial [Tanacetum coccineum]
KPKNKPRFNEGAKRLFIKKQHHREIAQVVRARIQDVVQPTKRRVYVMFDNKGDAYHWSGVCQYRSYEVSSDLEKVSTNFEKVSTDKPLVSIDGSKVSTDEQIEGADDQVEGTEENNEEK